MPPGERTPPLETTPTSKIKRLNRIDRFLIKFVFVVCAVSLFLLWRMTAKDPGNTPTQSKCRSNMHQIGLVIRLYKDDHAGWYPNELSDLLDEQITPEVFVCPDSSDVISDGATTRAIAADFRARGRLSYIYLGKGLNDKTADPDIVVLYEPLSNHAGDGMNILFGDGHAEWFNSTVGKQVIAAAATAQRVKIDAGVVSTAPIATTQPQVK